MLFLLSEWPRRIAHDGLSGGHVFYHHGAQADKGALADGTLVADKGAGKIAVPLDLDRAEQKRSRHHGDVFGKNAVVADDAKTVYLGPRADDRVVQRSALNIGQIADIHVIPDGHAAEVLDHGLFVILVLGGPKAVVADDHAGMDVAVFADVHPVDDGHIVPDHRAVADGDVPVQGAVVADADVLAQLYFGGDIRELADGRPVLLYAVKMLDGGEKGVFGLGSADAVLEGAGHLLGHDGQRDPGQVEALRDAGRFFDPGEGALSVMAQRGEPVQGDGRVPGEREGDVFALQESQKIGNVDHTSSSFISDCRSVMLSLKWRYRSRLAERTNSLIFSERVNSCSR